MTVQNSDKSENEGNHVPEYHWMCPYCKDPYFGEECDHNAVPAKKLILAIEDGTEFTGDIQHRVTHVGGDS